MIIAGSVLLVGGGLRADLDPAPAGDPGRRPGSSCPSRPSTGLGLELESALTILRTMSMVAAGCAAAAAILGFHVLKRNRGARIGADRRRRAALPERDSSSAASCPRWSRCRRSCSGWRRRATGSTGSPRAVPSSPTRPADGPLAAVLPPRRRPGGPATAPGLRLPSPAARAPRRRRPPTDPQPPPYAPPPPGTQPYDAPPPGFRRTALVATARASVPARGPPARGRRLHHHVGVLVPGGAADGRHRAGRGHRARPADRRDAPAELPSSPRRASTATRSSSSSP